MKSLCDMVGMPSSVFRESGGTGSASTVVSVKKNNINFVLLQPDSQVFCLFAVKNPHKQTLDPEARPTTVLPKRKEV